MKQTQSLTEGKILPTLTRFVLPILFALFLQDLYSAVDLLIVGKYATTADVSGVATGAGMVRLVTMAVAGLSVGVTVLIGQAIGQKDRERGGKIIGAGICLFGVLAIAITGLMFLITPSFAHLMNAPEAAFTQTVQYTEICSAGFLFIVSYNIIGGIFRGIGDSKTPLLTVFIACVCNIGGDLLCVAGWNMGAAGAAYATVFAQAVSVVLSLIIIRRRDLPIDLRREMVRFDGEIIKRTLKIGLPIALQDVLVSFSFLYIQLMVNSLGLVESAGIGVAQKITGFVMLIPTSFAQAMAAFTAQNNAAGHPERARQGWKMGILVSMTINVFVLYIAFFHGDILSSIFTKDWDVVLASADYVKAYAIDCMLTPLLFCSLGYFNGCEKTTFVMIQGLIGAFCVRIPVVWAVMHFIPDPRLFFIGLATPCSTVVEDIMSICMYIRLRKKEQNSIKGI